MIIENNTAADTLREKLVSVRRTAKVVKGGRIFGFSALVVVGDGSGKIGFGSGKSREVPAAIQKAIEHAKRNFVTIPLLEGTVRHPLVGKFGATKVVMFPASSGTGLIAGGAVRAVCEALGLRDVLSKCIGSRNPINVVRATMNALTSMVTSEQIARRRGINLNEASSV